MLHNKSLLDFGKLDNCKYCGGIECVGYVLENKNWKVYCEKCDRLSTNDVGGTGEAVEAWEKGEVEIFMEDIRDKIQNLFPGKLRESIGGGEYTYEYTEWLENIIIRMVKKENKLNDKIMKIIKETK